MSSPTPEAAVYVISVAAELTGLHPQTLRTYERLGLITPGRTSGGGRRYSHNDIELLREIAHLTAAGIGIEGVRRILELEAQVAALRAELDTTRQALREVVGRPPTGASPQGSNLPGSKLPGSKLPAVRVPPPAAQIVVWRRHT